MIGEYRLYIKNKKDYLERKKQLNREINKAKKLKIIYKGWKRFRLTKIINNKKDEIDRLNIMYRYYKRINEMKRRNFY
ncbi:hypothetical protein PMY56_13505 [Clostridium tertium]|uniref:hypothetical protein n=1 Tax=Clostridium tertium TaxID=1559 RepID=UPI002028AC7D|nr:hypothetical protein [Clostridium tertium]MDB1924086.1 hypothetical protein [Clostridium tertium]MDB1927153.1 hypothetical protein [Clostridium tertium]MDB1930930.1 hypothetical protein [Clostridium tertium]